MMMGPGQSELTGKPCRGVFTKPKFTLPELSWPVNRSYLKASRGDIQLLHQRAVAGGFTCIGFHGCGSNAAESILTGVKNVSIVNARGAGFAVGSLYKGIPSYWASRAKWGGQPTILRVYVRNWPSRRVNVDYEWGKMDPDDDVSEEGLEMVLRPGIFKDIVTLPSVSANDQSLVAPTIWSNCPTHSFGPGEMEVVQKLATHLKISLDALERVINTNPDRIQKAADDLRLKL